MAAEDWVYDDLYSVDDDGTIQHHSPSAEEYAATLPVQKRLAPVTEAEEPREKQILGSTRAPNSATRTVLHVTSSKPNKPPTPPKPRHLKDLRRIKSTPVFPSVSEILEGYSTVRRSRAQPAERRLPPPPLPTRKAPRPPIPSPLRQSLDEIDELYSAPGDIPSQPARRAPKPPVRFANQQEQDGLEAEQLETNIQPRRQIKSANTFDTTSTSIQPMADDGISTVQISHENVCSCSPCSFAALTQQTPGSGSAPTPQDAESTSNSDPSSVANLVPQVKPIGRLRKLASVFVIRFKRRALKKAPSMEALASECAAESEVTLQGPVSGGSDNALRRSRSMLSWGERQRTETARSPGYATVAATLSNTRNSPIQRRVTPFVANSLVEYYAPGGCWEYRSHVPEGRLYA